MTEHSPGHVKGQRTVLIAIAVFVLVTGLSLFAFYRVFVAAPRELAQATATEMRDFLQTTPQVKINETIVIEQTRPVLEVATVSRQVWVDYLWSHRWFGSTKSIRLQGVFTAKGGFDMHEPFTITIERFPLEIEATLPHPKLLSLEMTDYKIVQDENGWWNTISDHDRESAMRQLRDAAQTKVVASGFLEEVAESVEDCIREIAERNGAEFSFKQPAQDYEK